MEGVIFPLTRRKNQGSRSQANLIIVWDMFAPQPMTLFSSINKKSSFPQIFAGLPLLVGETERGNPMGRFYQSTNRQTVNIEPSLPCETSMNFLIQNEVHVTIGCL